MQDEREITRAIAEEFYNNFIKNIVTDVIIVGGGPSGLIAGKRLSQNGIKTLIIESNNYLGGGFWIGGYFMNVLTIRKNAEKLLKELEIPYKKANPELFTALAPHACAKLIADACRAGTSILNLTKFEDLILKDNIVKGVVINWSPMNYIPKALAALDPVAMESKIVIDATGHDAQVVASLAKVGLIKLKGHGPLWIEKSEDLVVEKTEEVFPGLIVCGMAVATVFGLPRMGPTFGSMLLSGEKAAEIAITKLKKG